MPQCGSQYTTGGDNAAYFLCSLDDVNVTRTAPAVSMTSVIVVCDRDVTGTLEVNEPTSTVIL